jgi:hypothetical protein
MATINRKAAGAMNKTTEDDNTEGWARRGWQPIGRGVYVGVRLPIVGYILERRDDGRWRIKSPNDRVVRHPNGNTILSRSARGAANWAALDAMGDLRSKRAAKD